MTKRGARQHARQGSRVDPFLSLLILVGIGVGTWQMDRGWRLTLLWLFLFAYFLLYFEIRPVKGNYTLGNIGWGALIGALVSVPLLIFAWPYLYSFAVQLFATNDARLLFYQMGLFAAPVEELFFRGFVQREKGLNLATLLYAGAALVFFVPGLRVPFLAVVVVTLAYALTGFVYGYVYARHGLSAAIASHFVVNVVLLVLPFLVQLLSEVM